MKKLSPLVFIGILSFAFSANALACTCAIPNQRQRYKERVGKETKDELIPYPYLVKFKVEKQWKGQKLNQITALASFDIKGFCNDLSLPIGKRLLIYAPRLSGQFLVERECGPNRYAEYAKDEISHLENIFFRFLSFIFRTLKFN